MVKYLQTSLADSSYRLYLLISQSSFMIRRYPLSASMIFTLNVCTSHRLWQIPMVMPRQNPNHNHENRADDQCRIIPYDWKQAHIADRASQ